MDRVNSSLLIGKPSACHRQLSFRLETPRACCCCSLVCINELLGQPLLSVIPISCHLEAMLRGSRLVADDCGLLTNVGFESFLVTFILLTCARIQAAEGKTI
jgi:hypothetical protein